VPNTLGSKGYHPSGHGTESGPDGTHHEDFYVCCHCQRGTVVSPREDPANLGGLCKVCMRMICTRCVSKGGCDPWEEQMERMEARQRFLRSAGLG
jgi:hypothetical protein